MLFMIHLSFPDQKRASVERMIKAHEEVVNQQCGLPE